MPRNSEDTDKCTITITYRELCSKSRLTVMYVCIITEMYDVKLHVSRH